MKRNLCWDIAGEARCRSDMWQSLQSRFLSEAWQAHRPRGRADLGTRILHHRSSVPLQIISEGKKPMDQGFPSWTKRFFCRRRALGCPDGRMRQGRSGHGRAEHPDVPEGARRFASYPLNKASMKMAGSPFEETFAHGVHIRFFTGLFGDKRGKTTCGSTRDQPHSHVRGEQNITEEEIIRRCQTG